MDSVDSVGELIRKLLSIGVVSEAMQVWLMKQLSYCHRPQSGCRGAEAVMNALITMYIPLYRLLDHRQLHSSPQQDR